MGQKHSIGEWLKVFITNLKPIKFSKVETCCGDVNILAEVYVLET